MKMTKTLVTGCSWTDRNYKSRFHPEIDTSWKKWDEYVGDLFGWDILNVAESGASNDRMLNRALESIYENDIERCVVGLTEWCRFTLPNNIVANTNLFLRDKTYTLKPNQQRALDFFKIYPFDTPFQKQLIQNNLFEIYRFIDICIHKNIEVIMFQMLNSLELYKYFCSDKEWIELVDVMMSNKYFNKIEKMLENNYNVKVLGWPFVQDLGGETINGLFQNHKDEINWLISSIDGHPNEKGHKQIAKIFTGWYNDDTTN